MLRKIKFHSVYLYLVFILSAGEFTACGYKHKRDDKPVVTEMPLPNTENSYYSPPSYQKESYIDREKIFVVVEQEPQFPGGEAELLNYISKNLIYPDVALRDGIQGKVICRFVVTRTGEVERPEILRSLDPNCDGEALKVIKSLPRFIPGKQNGVNVNVWYTLPIKFKLD